MSNTQDERIERFKHMTDADPGNELGHFSLGKAYFEAGKFAEATASFSRAVELNPILTKAYQFLGEAHDKLGEREKAIELLTRGVTVADKQGDRMPRDKMAGLLKEWGARGVRLTAALGVHGVVARAARWRSRRLRDRWGRRSGTTSVRLVGRNGFPWGRKSSTNLGSACAIRPRKTPTTST